MWHFLWSTPKSMLISIFLNISHVIDSKALPQYHAVLSLETQRIKGSPREHSTAHSRGSKEASEQSKAS